MLLFLAIFTQNINAFLLQLCQPNNNGCKYPIFDESNYSSNLVNELYLQDTSFDNVYINQTDEFNDIIINLDGINSNLDIFFKYLTSRITLQTRIGRYSKGIAGPRIYASNLEVTIENLDESIDKTVFIYYSFRFKKVFPKNPQKPLYLISTRYINYDYPYFYDENINIPSSMGSNLVYFTPKKLDLILDANVTDSFTMIMTSQPIYTNDYGFEASYDIYLSAPDNVKIIYSNNKVTVEYPNEKAIIIEFETHRVDMKVRVTSNSIITVEENTNVNDLISPCLSSNVISDNGLPTITGNWPILKTRYISGTFSEDGYEISDFYKFLSISGKFFFSATNFPIETISSEKTEFILTEQSSSINYIYNRIYYNLTLRTKEDVDTSFYINGWPTQTRNDDYSGYWNSFIITNSPKLTIFANTRKEIAVIGPAKLIYKEIDNSFGRVSSTLDFIQGGKITLSFGIDYKALNDRIDDVFHSYIGDFNDENFTSGEIANFYIGFVRDKIADISDIIKDLANEVFTPIKINQIDSDASFKSTIVLNRMDIPISSFYQNGLNDVVNSVCFENGKINMSQWTVKPGNNFIRGFVEIDDTTDLLFDQVMPTFSSTSISVTSSLTENDRCIGIQLKNVPASNFEFIFYTTNDTYLEILEKLDLFIVLSSSDLDAYSNLKNKNSKNFVVVVLDDLPDGSSINLKGIRAASNIILVGFKASTIDDIYELFDNLDKLNRSVGYEEYHRQEAECIIRVTSKMSKYRVKASVLFNTVNSLMIVNCDYFGTHIKCTRFWPVLSTFSNLNDLAKDFSAQITVTESITYNLISSLNFRDLTLFPVSINPPNVFSVDMINLTETHWNLFLKGIYDELGYRVESRNYPIEMAKISGQLRVYSFSTRCILNVPDTRENQKLRGISFINMNLYNLVIKNIHGMITFSEDDENKQKKSFNFLKENKLVTVIKKILSSKSSPSMFVNENEDNEEESNVFKFTGNWNKVQSIEGNIEIDTGNSPAVVETIPAVVAQVLEVKSERSMNLTSESSKMDFTQAQIITQEKTIRFTNKQMAVTFSNLTFNGDSPKLSLLIDEKQSKIVTDHILTASETTATVIGELEVKKSFELSPESSLSATSISSEKPQLKLNYRLGANFATIPDSIEPESIVLNYIGESDSENDVTSYSSFLGTIKKVKKFTGNDHNDRCKKWKEKATFESAKYPEFKGESQIVKTVCIDNGDSSTFSVNVTAVPSGEAVVPPDDGNGGNDENGPNDGGGSSGPGSGSGSGGKKKGNGIGTGAIIGIVVAVVVLVAIVSVLIWYFVFYRKNQAKESSKDENVAENIPNGNSGDQSEGEFSAGIVEYVE